MRSILFVFVLLACSIQCLKHCMTVAALTSRKWSSKRTCGLVSMLSLRSISAISARSTLKFWEVSTRQQTTRRHNWSATPPPAKQVSLRRQVREDQLSQPGRAECADRGAVWLEESAICSTGPGESGLPKEICKQTNRPRWQAVLTSATYVREIAEAKLFELGNEFVPCCRWFNQETSIFLAPSTSSTQTRTFTQKGPSDGRCNIKFIYFKSKLRDEFWLVFKHNKSTNDKC